MAWMRIALMLALTGYATVVPAQQEIESAAPPDDVAEEAAGGEPTTVIDDLSQAEIDAELARAEEVLDDPDGVKEFTQGKPLPADLPLALPSDF
ncbi:MAG: hypothetical protein ACE5G3_01615 [Gammaproteobacteria bacterium]